MKLLDGKDWSDKSHEWQNGFHEGVRAVKAIRCIQHRSRAILNQIVCEAAECPICEISGLLDALDLNRDEFLRIKACPAADEEIKGLCDRSQARTIRTVPLIVELEDTQKKLRRALVTIDELNEAAVESGDVP